MKQKLLLIGVIVAIPVAALAQYTGRRFLAVDRSAEIVSVRLDTNPVLTFTKDQLAGYPEALIKIKLIWGSATDVTMICTGSDDNHTTEYSLEDCDKSTAGLCQSISGSWNKEVTANKNWGWTVGKHGYNEIRCTFGHVGAGASDLIAATTRALSR